MNEHDELLLADAKFLELVAIKNLLDRLQLGEVIAAADRAQRRIEPCGFEIALSEEVAHELIPRMFEIELQLGPARCEIVAAEIIARWKRIRFDSVARC